MRTKSGQNTYPSKTVIKILHILDDQKFLQMAKDTFDLPWLENRFITSKDWSKRDENFCDILIIHYLDLFKATKILSHETQKPIVFFLWGADIYNLGSFYNYVLLPKTRLLRLKMSLNEESGFALKTIVKTLFPKTIDLIGSGKRIKIALKKADALVCITPKEIDLIKKFQKVQTPAFHINYLNTTLLRKNNILDLGNNILIGNSASFPNNHVEIIDQLAQINVKERKIILPLNYGDKKYGEWIANYAKKKLTNLEILLEFLPFNDYQLIIESCSIMIMNHIRQQALGNIIQGLVTGVHVYLHPSSPIFNFLLSKGFIIGSTKNLTEIRNLNKHEIQHNILLVNEYFGQQTVHQKIGALVTFVLNDKGKI